MQTILQVGEKAPDFSLPDQEKNLRSLNEFSGKNVVLVFFVGAFTTTCTKESCDFRDSMFRLIDLNAQILGIDVTVPWSNKTFSDVNRLPFPVLSDNKREVLEKYGFSIECRSYTCCWGKGCYPMARRSIIVIDKEGYIRYAWISANPTAEPKYEEIQEALEQIS